MVESVTVPYTKPCGLLCYIGRVTMTREDMIVLAEEAINNLEELRAYLVNQGD
jgi:hypothetical protein